MNPRLLFTLLASATFAFADTIDHIGSDELALEAAALLESQLPQAAAAVPMAAAVPVSSGGQWGSVIPWTPHIPVSAANLPDGRILTFASNQRTSFPSGPEFTYAATWNPSTGQFVEINNPRHDMFCGSLVMLPDGRVHVAGGRNTTVLSSIFDWRNNSWLAIPNMNDPRWYNTAVAMPNGTAVTFSGSGGSNTIERWTNGSGWARLTGIPWNQVTSEAGYLSIWHPFLSLAPNGNLIHFGPTDTMHWVNVNGNGSMTNSGNNVPGNHYPKEGCWVMFEEGRILVAGGSITTAGSDASAGNQSNAAYVVDVRGANPVVTSTASMRFGRQFANAAVLPNGEVLVMGGNSGIKFSDRDSVLAPEIWNPTTGTWREVNDMKTPRNYHSLALLLKDGRVLSAGGGLGGGNHQDGEIYSPSQLFTNTGTAAPRPTISSAPAVIGVGTQFNVSATAGLTSFALVKLSAITHSVNTDLRRIVMPHTELSSGSYRLTAHSNVNVMTPGYWFLFGLNSAGVWSEAAIVQVDATSTVAINNPGTQTGFAGTAVNVTLTGSGPVGATLRFSATGLPTGLSISQTGVIIGTPTTPGNYNVNASVTNTTTTASTSFTWTIYNTEGQGLIRREWWLGIAGSALTDLTNNAAYPNSPTGTDTLTSFETPTDWADNLGQRVRGYLRPTVSGQYRFWIAGDDESRLILSTSSAVSTTVIARVPTWTPSRAWTNFPEQRSALITLQAGQSYYIEALMKEGGGGDNLAVAWALPGTTTPVVIPNSALSLQPGVTNVPPTLTNPGNRTSVRGLAVSLQVQAADSNGDAIRYTATGLPTGLSIGLTNGLITGTPTAAGNFNVTLSVTDNINTAVTANFVWTINPPLSIGTLSGAPIATGTAKSLSITSTGGLNSTSAWDFGDGTTATGASVTKTFNNPGRYLVTVTVTDATGARLTASYRQGVFAPRTSSQPRQSSPIAYETRNGANARVWVVNPDNDSVSVFDAVTNTRVAEISVGKFPHFLAIAPDGRVWVTNSDASTLSIISNSTLAVAQTISLPRGSRPQGVVFSSSGTDAWIALEAKGQVLRLNPSTAAISATINVGPNPRHIAITGDSSKVLVARFITPLLPGESTATITTSASVGAEIVNINPASNSIASTIILQHSERADTSVSSRGIPNYLGAPAISPDGLSAWVPSKQDNIKRGVLRDGLQLTHDSAVRSIASRINLTTLTEDLAARVDFNDAGIASAAVYDPNGIYLFVAHEGGREVAVIDAWNRAEITRFRSERAPQGLTISPDGSRLYVHNFMERSVTVHDVSQLQNGLDAPVISTVASLRTITTERLSAVVLNGKQLFYDAQDPRLDLQQYISCASCHNTGGTDGRVWDFTGFGEGLRNTTTLKGTSGTGHGPVHWTGNFDEIQDFENQIRNFQGGSGLITGGTPHAPLSTPNAGRSTDLDALASYLSSLNITDLSPSRNSDGSLTAAATAGKQVFADFNCAQCHSGANFTNSALNIFANVGTIKPSTGKRLNATLPGLDVPTLRGLWSSAPYLHDGSAATITAAINAHNTVKPTGTALTNLVAYLDSIDSAETTAPVLPAPSVTLSAPVTTTGAFTVTITASQAITGLTASDFTVTNGTAGTLSGSGSAYTLSITPTAAGNVSVQLPANRAINSASVGNLSSNTTTTAYNVPDTTAPSVTLSTPTTSTSAAFVVTATFSESITGLALSDFIVTNGTASGLTGNSVTITPAATGSVTVRLPAAAVTDAAGNASLASNTLNLTYTAPDTTAPSVTLSTPTTSVSAAFVVTATFSEVVTGLTLADFVVTNGNASSLTSTSVTITPTAAGTVSIRLPAGAVADAAGNASLASNTLSVSYQPPVGNVLQGLDIGTVGLAGSTSFNGGVYTLRGSGGDIYNNADGFHFASASITGDGEIRARITSQTNTNSWAKAGVMIRSTTAASSVHGTTFATPIETGNGYEFIHRLVTDGWTDYVVGPPNNPAPNNWVRLVRSGNVLTGYASANGSTWTLIRSQTYASLPTTMLFGLVACSNEPSALLTATFDNVQLSGWQNALSAPTGLSSTALSSSAIRLNWTDAASNETGYRIERAVGTGAMTQLIDLPANTTTYGDTGLTAATAYQYRVSAFNANGSASGGTTSNTTLPAANVPPTLRNPGNRSSEIQVPVTLQLVAGDANRDPLRFTASGLPTSLVIDSTTGVISGTPTATGVFDTSATVSDGRGGNATVNFTWTVNPTTLPAAPLNLTTVVESSSSIYLDWTDAANNETSYRIERATDSGAFSVVATLPASTGSGNPRNHTDTGLTASTTYRYRVSAVNSAGAATAGPVSATTRSSTISLTGIDIGSVGLAGSTTQSNGVYTVRGSGGDIYDNADGFHFARINVTGDGEIRARVTSQSFTDSWCKAGVMIRATTSPSSVHGLTFATPTSTGNGFEFIRRISAGGWTDFHQGPANNPAPNNWVRVVRSGNTISGYASANGTSWTLIHTQTYSSLPATLLFGLGVCSNTPSALCTATFDNVQILAASGLGAIAAAAPTATGGSAIAADPLVAPQLIPAADTTGNVSSSFTASQDSRVVHELETLPDLAQSPAGWTVSSVLPVGTGHALSYQSLNALFPGAKRGFARLVVRRDSDSDGSMDARHAGQTIGFLRQTFTTGTSTAGMPFMPICRLAATVTASSGTTLTLDKNLPPLTQGREYYVEAMTGEHSGHWWDLEESASSGASITIKGGTAPASLAGELVVLRLHHTVNDLFPPASFTGTNNPSTADRVLFHNGTAFESLWLWKRTGQAGRWIKDSDVSLADGGTRIIRPAEGVMLQLRGPAVALTFSGEVRTTPSLIPLRTGTQLVANTWVGAASPLRLGFVSTQGLVASSNPSSADRLNLWSGDLTPGGSSYQTFFLARFAGQTRWVSTADAELTDVSTTDLIPAGRAVFVRSVTEKPTLTLPSAWRP